MKVLAEARPTYQTDGQAAEAPSLDAAHLAMPELYQLIQQVEKEMKEAAKALEFERAAVLAISWWSCVESRWRSGWSRCRLVRGVN